MNFGRYRRSAGHDKPLGLGSGCVCVALEHVRGQFSPCYCYPTLCFLLWSRQQWPSQWLPASTSAVYSHVLVRQGCFHTSYFSAICQDLTKILFFHLFFHVFVFVVSLSLFGCVGRIVAARLWLMPDPNKPNQTKIPWPVPGFAWTVLQTAF